ncbi:MAG: hypothetical protein ACOC2T_03420, partial [Planctomycetota bacterium]
QQVPDIRIRALFGQLTDKALIKLAKYGLRITQIISVGKPITDQRVGQPSIDVLAGPADDVLKKIPRHHPRLKHGGAAAGERPGAVF